MNTVAFSVLSNWGTGFEGQITLTNGGDLLVENWTLEFTSSFPITSLWNAEIVSRVGDRYTIRYPSWKPNLAPGESYSFGFLGTPVNGTVPAPTNYTLNGVPLSSGGSLPTLSINNVSIVEGDSGVSYLVYTVSLSAASSQTVTVNYGTSDGTAKAGEDYTALTGTLTFSPGQTSKTIQIAIKGDTTIEANETFNLNLSNAVGATIAKAQGIGTITNNDQAPVVNNGNVAVNFKVDSQWNTGFTGTVTLTNQGTTVVNNWKLAFDSLFVITSLWNVQQLQAVNKHYEFANLSWNAQIPVGGSVSFGFTGDWAGGSVPTPSNYVFNGVSLGGGGSSPLPTLSINDVTIQEGNNAIALFTVSLNAASSQTVQVNYGTQNGTAIAGSDYQALTGTLTFAPGETRKTIAVNVLHDVITEGNETFSLNLAAPVNATIQDNQGIATILDKSPTLPGVSINDVNIVEGNSGITNANFTVTLSAVSTSPITVNYATQNGTALSGSDYTAKTGTLTFSPGQLSQTIAIAINGDTTFEGNETFNVNLSNPSNAAIIDGLGVGTITNDDSNPQKYVVGAYYPEWAIYDRNFQVKDMPAKNLTHIFYAFAKIDSNGEVATFDPWAATQITFNGKYTWEQSSANQAGNLAELKALKSQNPHLSNMLSIGGWTLSSPFSDVALTDASRKKFATSAVNFIVKYGFDGIDLDWEYPVGGGLEGNVNRPADKQNYTLLVAELRNQLNVQETKDGKDYQLTIAAPAGFDKIANFDLAGMAPYLDFFNVMTYDYHGAWEKQTNHQAALYSNPNDPSAYKAQYNIASTIQQYKNAGVKAEDIVLGAPLYGRSWTGVSSFNDGLFQSATGAGPGTWEAGSFDYKDLYQKVNNTNSGYVRYWDDVAKAAYVYNRSLGVFSTYEDKQSLGVKLDYLKTQGLGGLFFWEASADLPGTHADSLIGLAANQLGVVV